MLTNSGSFILLLLCAATVVSAEGIRDRMRIQRSEGTAVTPSQATDLTLTLTAVEPRQIQTWVRTGGEFDSATKIVTVFVYPPSAALIKLGQRARCFPLASRSSMYQGKIARVTTQTGRVMVDIALAGQGYPESSRYLAEIVVERGVFLSIPNEAIIGEGSKSVVYVQHHPGHYVPQEIQVGLQGELYTQVLQGVEADDQVITLGSFFVDAQHKLKSTGAAGGMTGHDHSHH
jgi:hypothetical protein